MRKNNEGDIFQNTSTGCSMNITRCRGIPRSRSGGVLDTMSVEDVIRGRGEPPGDLLSYSKEKDQIPKSCSAPRKLQKRGRECKKGL